MPIPVHTTGLTVRVIASQSSSLQNLRNRVANRNVRRTRTKTVWTTFRRKAFRCKKLSTRHYRGVSVVIILDMNRRPEAPSSSVIRNVSGSPGRTQMKKRNALIWPPTDTVNHRSLRDAKSFVTQRDGRLAGSSKRRLCIPIGRVFMIIKATNLQSLT